jgi:hypothetical protein
MTEQTLINGFVTFVSDGGPWQFGAGGAVD